MNKQLKNKFLKNGYVIVRKFITKNELIKLNEPLVKDKSIIDHQIDQKDSKGLSSNVTVWSGNSNDLYSNYFKYDKLVQIIQNLLEDEVYLYHAKLTLKKPLIGGSWDWHQDFGYWFKNGCLFPDMASVYVALNDATVENGCIKILEGSHRLGRLDHEIVNDQTSINSELLELLKKKFKIINCILHEGDILIFHSNILHCSEQNKSNISRNGLIGVYNSKHNNPIKKHHYPAYYKMNILNKKQIFSKSSINKRRNYVKNKREFEHYIDNY